MVERRVRTSLPSEKKYRYLLSTSTKSVLETLSACAAEAISCALLAILSERLRHSSTFSLSFTSSVQKRWLHTYAARHWSAFFSSREE